MPTPILDLLKDDSDLTMHTHTEADLGATLDTRYLKLDGSNDPITGSVIFNDNVSVLLGTGSDGELFHDGSNTYFQNNTGNIIIENDASDGDITFKVNDGGVDTTVMTLDGATGNVGIGTTSPSAALQVNGTTVIGNAVADTYGKLQVTSSLGGYVFAAYDAAVNNSLFFVGDNKPSVSTKNIIFGTVKDGGGQVAGPSSGNYLWGLGQKMIIQDYSKAGIGFYQGDVHTTGAYSMYIDTVGNVGIGTTSPANLLSLGGNSARIFWLERHTTANTAGNTLTVTAGGATSGATDKAGGALILQGGLSTGSAESGVTIQGCVAGASGTTDRTQTTMIQVLGNKVGFFTATPVVQQTELTDELTTITFTAPGTPDYAIQDLTAIGGYGFVTKDEGNSVLAVIANLQARVNELETKLTAYGLLIDAD